MNLPNVSIQYMLAALGNSEFFLSEAKGMVIANLRIPPTVQVSHPEFVGWVLNSLNTPNPTLGFPPTIIWRGTAYHGWYCVRFQSSLHHYLSLAGKKSNPFEIQGRCLDSNLPSNIQRTRDLLKQLLASQNLNQEIPSIIPDSIIPEIISDEEFEIIQSAHRNERDQPDWSAEDQLELTGADYLPLPRIATGTRRTRAEIESIAHEINFSLRGKSRLRKQELLDTINS